MAISERSRTLVDRYMADVATAADLEELSVQLAEHPEVAMHFAEVARLDSYLDAHFHGEPEPVVGYEGYVLHDAVHAAGGGHGGLRAIWRPLPRLGGDGVRIQVQLRHLVGVLLVALLIGVLAMRPWRWIAPKGAPTVARLNSVRGGVYVRRAGITFGARAAMRLVAEDGVVTLTENGAAEIVWPDETVFRLAEDTELFLGAEVGGESVQQAAHCVSVRCGEIEADIAERSTDLTIATPHAYVRCSAVEIKVVVGTESTRLDVLHGRCSVRRSAGGGSRPVPEGSSALVSDTGVNVFPRAHTGETQPDTL